MISFWSWKLTSRSHIQSKENKVVGVVASLDLISNEFGHQDLLHVDYIHFGFAELKWLRLFFLIWPGKKGLGRVGRGDILYQ